MKLIAEPWDVGAGGYQVGGFPTGWSEWNDQFRDTVRAFWRGDPGQLPKLDAGDGRLARDLRAVRAPAAGPRSTSSPPHDGFTLHDLVSYNERHNEANGEDNQDGHGHNLSWNCGVEGPTDDPDILRAAARGRSATSWRPLLLSQGVPMLLMGDELSRTQGGNNNAYCPGQRDQLARLAATSGDPALPGLRAGADRLAQALRRLPPPRLPDRRDRAAQRPQGRLLARARRPRDDDERLGRRHAARASACSSATTRPTVSAS